MRSVGAYIRHKCDINRRVRIFVFIKFGAHVDRSNDTHIPIFIRASKQFSLFSKFVVIIYCETYIGYRRFNPFVPLTKSIIAIEKMHVALTE